MAPHSDAKSFFGEEHVLSRSSERSIIARVGRRMGEQDRDQQSPGTHAADSHDPVTLEGLTAAWHEASDALRDSEQRYRELVEYSLGLICTHDLTGTILSINPAAANSLGYRPEDGIGRSLREFLAPDTRHLFDDYLLRIHEQGHDAGLMRVVARDGAERVWMYRNVVSQGPGGRYVLGHAIDVSDRINVERTLRHSEQALRNAQVELETRVAERTAALAAVNERLLLEIAEREEAERSLAFLATFSEQLAPLITFESLIDVLRRLPVPFLADWTTVHLIDDDGSVRYIPDVHADPAIEPLLATAGGATATVDSLSHLAQVVATGRLTIVAFTIGEGGSGLVGGASSLDALKRLETRSAAMVPLIVNGKVKGVLSLLSAKPDRFAASESLVVEDVARRIGLALDRIQLYREAQEANRLKDEFLGLLSHELRTPLNAIFGWARILRARDLDARTAHAVEVIERNAEAQVRLIEEVLDVSRIIMGKMFLVSERVDVGALLRVTIDTLRPTLQTKQIRLEERISETPPVVGDSHRLQQVFWNVLSNALKFTNGEGSIAVTLHSVGTSIEFTISDTGVGIRRDVLPFVFDRFRQADSSTTRKFGGLGLGLTIVKHIVELHGGTVHAASAGEGHGATFIIKLPSAEGCEVRARVPPAREPAASTLLSVLRGRTVLVVEDHDDARELIVGVLEGEGASVLSASTAQEAIDRATAVRPDVLVADLGLPGQDGYELLRRLRHVMPQIPALALTAYARAADRDRVLAAGFQKHVVKPVDPQALLQSIAALLESNLPGSVESWRGNS
jgi:PAS domain S-box-containing protein